MPHGCGNSTFVQTGHNIISLGHLNIAGWTEKNSKLREEIICNANCDIYSICETHLSKSVNFEPSVKGYKLFRHDRSFVHKNAPKTLGGVGFLVKRELLIDYSCEIIDKSYEGVLVLELVHKVIGTKLLFIASYLPPECSPHGRNASGFYNYLSSICYSQFSEYDRVYFCGDINARIGHMADYCSDIDIELPKRVVLDEKENNHGKGFIEFLLENKLCVLNGRFDPKLDNFTYIGRGKSVVDYIFCSHDQLEYCSNFQVLTSKDIANTYGLQQLIGEKSKLPDHSLLKVDIKIVCNIEKSESIPTNISTPAISYNVSNIPNTFMNTEEARLELLELINQLELNRETQQNVNRFRFRFRLGLLIYKAQNLKRYYSNAPNKSTS